MAEVLGVVASGISIGALVGQIASSVVKLKSYMDLVKDAPEDIKILVDEIEDLQLLISDIEDDRARNPYTDLLLESSSASRCLAHCRRGVERLRRVVDAMAVDFNNIKPMKRKWVAASVVWKRETLEKYKAELASAVRLLTLSHQIYTRSLIQLQPDIITSRVARLIQAGEGEIASRASINPSASSSNVEAEGNSSRSMRTQDPWLRWAGYSLLIGRAWEFEIFKCQQGWNFFMCMYGIVSSDSLVARYTEEGDIEGLQLLFSLGKASPHTICIGSELEGHVHRTLLRIGAEAGNYGLCEFLINQGADPTFTPHNSWSTLESFAMNAIYRNPSPDDFFSLANLLGSRTEVNLPELRDYRGPVSAFSVLLKHMDTHIGELPMVLRCDLAIGLAAGGYFNSPDLFLLALHGDPKSPPAVNYQNEDGTTLLHVVARALGTLSAYDIKKIDWIDFRDYEKWIPGWKSIIRALVASGEDLHVTCPFPRYGLGHVQVTPLLFMFIYFYRIHWVGINRQHAINSWVSTLSDSGVDLMEYGQRERLTWNTIDISMEPPPSHRWSSNDYYYYFGRRRLISFDYGPSPKDWILWENEPTDEFAGDFWLMLDRKEEIMPGTWID